MTRVLSLFVPEVNKKLFAPYPATPVKFGEVAENELVVGSKKFVVESVPATYTSVLPACAPVATVKFPEPELAAIVRLVEKVNPVVAGLKPSTEVPLFPRIIAVNPALVPVVIGNVLEPGPPAALNDMAAEKVFAAGS